MGQQGWGPSVAASHLPKRYERNTDEPFVVHGFCVLPAGVQWLSQSKPILALEMKCNNIFVLIPLSAKNWLRERANTRAIDNGHTNPCIGRLNGLKLKAEDSLLVPCQVSQRLCNLTCLGNQSKANRGGGFRCPTCLNSIYYNVAYSGAHSYRSSWHQMAANNNKLLPFSLQIFTLINKPTFSYPNLNILAYISLISGEPCFAVEARFSNFRSLEIHLNDINGELIPEGQEPWSIPVSLAFVLLKCFEPQFVTSPLRSQRSF